MQWILLCYYHCCDRGTFLKSFNFIEDSSYDKKQHNKRTDYEEDKSIIVRKNPRCSILSKLITSLIKEVRQSVSIVLGSPVGKLDKNM